MTDSLKGLAERLRERVARAREPIGKMFDPRGLGSASTVPVTEDNAMLWLTVREADAILAENARLRAVVEDIAYEPLGHAEASWEEALTIATSIARAALDVGEQSSKPDGASSQ